MAPDLPFHLLGLLLLWFPRAWLRRGKPVFRRRRRRGRAQDLSQHHSPADSRLNLREEFSKLRNFFDLLRAAAGSLAVIGVGPIQGAFAVGEAGDPRMTRIVWLAQVAILLIALLAQTVRRQHGRLTLFAPVFFLAGMSLALCGPWAALFSFVLIWGVNPILSNTHAFLCLYAVAMSGFGWMFGQVDRKLAVVGGLLCFLPALLSWMIRRPLTVFSRKTLHLVGGQS
jgi:hypothetical protein